MCLRNRVDQDVCLFVLTLTMLVPFKVFGQLRSWFVHDAQRFEENESLTKSQK